MERPLVGRDREQRVRGRVRDGVDGEPAPRKPDAVGSDPEREPQATPLDSTVDGRVGGKPVHQLPDRRDRAATAALRPGVLGPAEQRAELRQRVVGSQVQPVGDDLLVDVAMGRDGVAGKVDLQVEHRGVVVGPVGEEAMFRLRDRYEAVVERCRELGEERVGELDAREERRDRCRAGRSRRRRLAVGEPVVVVAAIAAAKSGARVLNLLERRPVRDRPAHLLVEVDGEERAHDDVGKGPAPDRCLGRSHVPPSPRARPSYGSGLPGEVEVHRAAEDDPRRRAEDVGPDHVDGQCRMPAQELLAPPRTRRPTRRPRPRGTGSRSMWHRAST